MTDNKPSRKEQILQALAQMLESQPGSRITTAGLARQVGVSEAALYRHFPSKARMFEGLLDFSEETIFSRVNQITAQGTAIQQVAQICALLLGFMERNPGMTRLLTGTALNGEHPRLHQRVEQFYARLESQIKQVLREAELKEGLRTQTSVAATANLIMATVEGHIAQFARSDFRQPPSQHWAQQWPLLEQGLFR